ncbi:MAG: zf-HC2 domain-containing protein [Phycisphaerae bacterium]|nr:zf-HC2 domain-containing protein [Phycisphaerae bacterium]
MSEDRDNTEELLSAYIDGELTPEESRSVEQAVATDPELALELHELNAARRLLMGLPKQRAPRGFVRKVMVRAERKHLLGDHHAGGAFRAARWITLAVAATVLLAAGLGIMAVNMLNTNRSHPSIAVDTGVGDGLPAGPEGMDFGSGTVSGKGSGGRGEKFGKAGGSDDTNNVANVGGKLVIADEAFDYAVANAGNASIYTHDVSNTLAVLHKTLDRNDVLPLELDALDSSPVPGDKPSDKTPEKSVEKKRDVSRGALNFYYNKKQDDEQVQIVVLASDTVIEQLNGDLSKLARVQMVSQAPTLDYADVSSAGALVARRAGPPRTRKRSELDIHTDGTLITKGGLAEDPVVSKDAGSRAKSKTETINGGSTSIAKGAPAPAVDVPAPVASKVTKPGTGSPTETRGPVSSTPPKQPAKAASRTTNVGQDGRPITSVADSDASGQKGEPVGKGGAFKLKPAPKPTVVAKRPVVGPTTRPADLAMVNGGIQKKLGLGSDRSELEVLSAQIAEDQKRGRSAKELAKQYGRLNSAFRQRILNDDLRRNVQSQREQGVNVRALVININRRDLINAKPTTTQSGGLRFDRALSRPRDATTSSPVSESTTQRAAPPVDTSR